MASVENLIAEGMPASLSKQIGLDIPATGLTAAGSTQAGALALTSSFSIFGTVSSSTGCLLKSGSEDAFVYNGGSNTLSVYPPLGLGMNFNGTTANTAFSVPAGKGAYFWPARGLTIAAIVSA